MDSFIELIKILGPASLVLYTAYLMLRGFLNKQLEENRLQIQQKNQEVVAPIRLQAYERVCLLLERISPNNLIPRLNNPEFSAKEFQQVLISEIREEFNHNLSQQIYMSADAWSYVSGAVEKLLSMINEVGNSITDEDKSLTLAQRIFEKYMQEQEDITKQAIDFLKKEIQTIF